MRKPKSKLILAMLPMVGNIALSLLAGCVRCFALG